MIHKGNALVEGREFRGWFVGDLPAWHGPDPEHNPGSGFDLRTSQNVEMKWGVHPAGQRRPGGWAPVSGKTCLSILIQGKFRLFFRSPGGETPGLEHLLEQQGDYVLWQEQVEHDWQAEQDSIVLTVRWQYPPAGEGATAL